MPITPFFIWVLTYAVCSLILLFAPAFRSAMLCALALHIAVLIWGIVNIKSRFFGKVYCGMPNERLKLALTFDDGPDPNLTSDILDILNTFGVKATFFIIGNRARTYPEIVKKAYEAGHCIACHDLKHGAFSNFRMTEGIFRDVSAAQRIIKAIIGTTPLLYRPPVGLMNPHVHVALARLNMTCIGWSGRVRDAGNRRVKTLYSLPSLAKPGSIVLLHDCLPIPENKKIFLAQLEKLLLTIKEKGLRPVRVDELLNMKAYG